MASLFAPYILSQAGLVAYWRLGEASGTSAADSKGANTGSYKGAPVLGVAGALPADGNTAVTFNGTTQWVSVPSAEGLNFGDPFSIVFAFKRSGTGKTDCIVDKGPGNLIVRMDGEDRLLVRCNSVADILKSTTKYTDTNWHLGVLRRSAGTWVLEVDGVNVTGAVTTRALAPTATVLSLGASEAGVEDWWRGSLDEIAIFSSFLSTEQAQALWQLSRAAAQAAALLGVGQ